MTSNTGNYNTGHYNTGNYNTGYYNTGHYNTGYRNTGNRNTGYYNTGYRNTGNYNTGYRNTGYRNTGNYNTGDCNTTTPTVRLFNKDSGWEFLSPNHNKFRSTICRLSRPLCEWVSDTSMTDQEKEDYSAYKTTGGYLKVNKERRNNIEISKEDREFLRSVPNFDNEILKECTGIDLDNEKVKIIIDKKEIWISKESAMALKEQL